MEPVTEVELSVFGGKGVNLFHEQFLSVIYEARELLHRAHTIWGSGNTFLLCMYCLSRLREDVWVLRRREDAIEVRFPKSFTHSEYVFRRIGR